MTLAELLAWQWSDYGAKHANRSNLLVHIVAVPVFVLSALGLVVALLTGSVVDAIVAVFLIGASLLAQKQGHDLEEQPSEPFAGPVDAVRRLLAEQFVTFPKFVASGAWLHHLRSGRW